MVSITALHAGLSLVLSILWRRPSTPVFDLLEHRYQERWLQDRKEAEKKQREKISQRVSQSPRVMCACDVCRMSCRMQHEVKLSSFIAFSIASRLSCFIQVPSLHIESANSLVSPT